MVDNDLVTNWLDAERAACTGSTHTGRRELYSVYQIILSQHLPVNQS